MMGTELEERDVAVGYLSIKDTPLFTLAELADLIDAFIKHLECNKDVLIRTGLNVDFEGGLWRHPWGLARRRSDHHRRSNKVWRQQRLDIQVDLPAT